MAEAAYVGRITLYLFDVSTGQYTDYGAHGVAIMGSPDGVYKMGCYNEKNEYTATTVITANNEASANVALQGGGYVSFKDEQSRHWSMQFSTEDDAIEFGAHFAVAMYGAAFQPESNIIVCDVAQGKKEKVLYANDKVKVRYTSWVVQRGVVAKSIGKLGSKLESNEHEDKPYAFTVPANHMSVTKEMKGFEGMVVGVGEEGKRYIVIPMAARRGSGPSAHMCFYVSVLRKKEDTGPEGSQQPQQLGGPQGGQWQQQGGNGQWAGQGGPQGGQWGMQQNGQWGQGGGALAIGGGPQHGQLALGGPQGSAALAVVEEPKVAPPVVVEAPPPPPPGFSAEQLQIVDRMRDQIQALSLQLRDTTAKLNMFRNDYNQHASKERPQSLAAAQLEHSISKMLQDTEAMKEELSQRDTSLRQHEDRNKELQRKVDRFSSTANQLADEKKAAMNAGSEEKIDSDRRIAMLQAQLTRIHGERDDVHRHMSTVKRLLEVSDQDMKTEKNRLQLAVVQFQTNESKLVTCEENLAEERARKKVLESKVISLGEEMRSVAEELRIKEGQIEERKRKIEADKLHYTQVLEEERSQAAVELRELRQELIDEIAIRDRRYQEEKQRISQESIERGRIQGVEDGTNEALLEADAKIQDFVLQVQRCKSEVEAMKIRVRQTKEQSEADQRRINAQIQTLTRTLDDLVVHNSNADLEIDTLKASKESIEEQTYDLLSQALRGLSRPIAKKDLLTLVHELRTRKPLDYHFELDREREEMQRIEEERQQVAAWVRASVANVFPPPPMPALRTKAPEERPILSTFDPTAAPPPAAPVIHKDPTPQPPSQPYTPGMYQLPPAELRQAPATETAAHAASAPAPTQDWGDEDDEDANPWDVPPPVPTTSFAVPPSSTSGSFAPVSPPTQAAAAPPTPPPQAQAQPLPAIDSDDENPWNPATASATSFVPAQPQEQQVYNSHEAPLVDQQDTEYQPDEEAVAPSEDPFESADVSAENFTRVPQTIATGPTPDEEKEEEEEEPAPPVAPAAQPKAVPPPKRAALPTFSDSDDDGAAQPAAPAAAPPKKAAPAKKPQSLFDDSDGDEDFGAAPAPAAPSPPKASPTGKRPAPKKTNLFDDSD